MINGGNPPAHRDFIGHWQAPTRLVAPEESIRQVDIQGRLRTRSARALASVENRLSNIVALWFAMAWIGSALRIFLSPLPGAPDLGTVLPYILIVSAPMVSIAMSLRWFARGNLLPQPGFRLARVGRWNPITAEQASRHPLFGSHGIMLSLLLGMLLNVPVRMLEYFAAMPALAGPLPPWLSTLRAAMTLDVVLLSSLYTICFAAALRKVPLFPRLLAATWLVDLTMQLGIAKALEHGGGVPVAVGSALRPLLDGNVDKVLISVGLWLPYLLLSERVNVTFRHRVPNR